MIGRRWLIVGSLAAVVFAGCSSGGRANNSGATLPGPSQGYLSTSDTEVVFIQLARQAGTMSGTEDWAQTKGSPPYEQVSVGDSNVTGVLTQSGIELSFNGSARQFGALGSGTLQIEVPQVDGTLANVSFNVASVDQYNSALSQLRSTVTAANNAATTTTTTEPPLSVTSPTTTPAPSGSPTVPVVGCATTYGGGTPPTQAAPAPEPVDVPPATADQLGLYTTDTFGVPPILAPRGWSCSAEVGADGSTSISVYPPGSSAPKSGSTGQQAVVAQSDSACQGCVWGTVCRFVPAAGNQLGYTSLNCPAVPERETTYWIKGSAADGPPLSDIIGFEDHTSPNATDGVVLYDDTGHQGSASEDDCTLPATQHFLCTAILNNFSGQAWLMN